MVKLKKKIQNIREQDSLKQGLKLIIDPAELGSVIIREQDPLKQGLKPDGNEDMLDVALTFASKIH